VPRHAPSLPAFFVENFVAPKPTLYPKSVVHGKRSSSVLSSRRKRSKLSNSAPPPARA
jgi:hypothetical protein